MILSEINIYPVKSLSGISLQTSKTEERGLRFDRRMMLVDQNNKFITQRECPQMAAIRLKISENYFVASKSEDEILIPCLPNSEKKATVKVWSSSVKAVFYGSEINEWFSDILKTKCSLVFMNEDAKRIVSPFYAVRKFKDKVSFADGYPYLLIGENSLVDLNGKLEKPLPMNRFRPNLVIKDSAAFAEDEWKKIKIGDTIFHVVKPCARCVMTTIEQSNGVKDGNEPLKTLAKYRTKNGKILFGQNLIAENAGGFLKVGDKVEILELKN
jgi:uncharacterized protein